MTGRIPVVHVLMATFNGERHIAQQWRSLEKQEGVEVVLHVADDGSADGTVTLLERLEGQRSGAIARVEWLRRPARRSATRSFLMLAEHAVTNFPDARWFAYCDQDDIWMPGKLAAAVAKLVKPGDLPRLYGGRTMSVDESDMPMALSPLYTKPPDFRNALVQNIMGGNTMVMNRPAAQLVARCAHSDAPLHDWLTYQLVSGTGGVVIYDEQHFVRYRQHAGNVIGSSDGWTAVRRKLGRIKRNQYREWNDLNLGTLRTMSQGLTQDSRQVMDAFAHARSSANALDRLRWLARSGVFRQPRAQHFALIAACLLGRI